MAMKGSWSVASRCLLYVCIFFFTFDNDVKGMISPPADKCLQKLSNISAAEDSCTLKPVDVVLLLDSSSSVQPADWRREVSFASDLVASLHIAPDRARIAVATFARRPRSAFDLHDYSNCASASRGVKGRLMSLDRRRGSTRTNTGLALRYVRQRMLTKRRGARDGVAKLVILLTDGKSRNSRQTVREAMFLKRFMKAFLIVIGIGRSVNKEELKQVASNPKLEVGGTNNLFLLENFKELDSVFRTQLSEKACEVNRDPATFTLQDDDPLVWNQCLQRGKLSDIVFIADPLMWTREEMKAIVTFIKGVIDKLPNAYRLGFVPESLCTGKEAYLPPVDFINNQADLGEVVNRTISHHSLAVYIKYTETRLLTFTARDRVAVVFVNSGCVDKSLQRSMVEMTMSGNQLIVVWSQPDSGTECPSGSIPVEAGRHLTLKATSVLFLDRVEGDLMRKICPGRHQF